MLAPGNVQQGSLGVGSDLIWYSAVELLRGYRSGAISPVDATRAVLERIADKDEKTNAFCVVDEERALAAARDSEARWRKAAPAGRLDGVPTVVKDLLLTKDWPTLRGSKTTDTNQAWDEDAPGVARAREHGAVLIGKTTTPEYGWKGVTDSPVTGITRNPWDLTKTPGGSSGGSSAAVAAGMSPLSFGTDGGGSVRIPAGFTGIFGHKPSFGRVPAYPLSPFGTVAHVGPMTRTVEDAALMLTVISEPDARDWHALPYEGADYTVGLASGIRGLKIAYSPGLGYVDVDPEIAKLVETAVKSLEDLGAIVEQVDPGFDDPMDIFRTLWWAGAGYALGGLPDDQKALLDRELASVVEEGAKLTLQQFQEASAQRGGLGSHMRQFMERYDLLVTPTLPIPAFEAGALSPVNDSHGKWTNWTPFSFPFNLTQQPAASVPCGFTSAGLPAGLHIVGRMFDDVTVLRASYAYEQAHDWSRRRPEF
jgi:aspartyl-tRNA(Asn)/glutamyl-tRNA(Gln) amidotransferase subunit A